MRQWASRRPFFDYNKLRFTNITSNRVIGVMSQSIGAECLSDRSGIRTSPGAPKFKRPLCGAFFAFAAYGEFELVQYAPQPLYASEHALLTTEKHLVNEKACKMPA
jgi:hypothetical protein